MMFYLFVSLRCDSVFCSHLRVHHMCRSFFSLFVRCFFSVHLMVSFVLFGLPLKWCMHVSTPNCYVNARFTKFILNDNDLLRVSFSFSLVVILLCVFMVSSSSLWPLVCVCNVHFYDIVAF